LATKKIHMLAARVQHVKSGTLVSLPVEEFTQDIPDDLMQSVVDDMNLLLRKLCPAYHLSDDGMTLSW